jgi:tRNA threonylcarbamoyladenosine biosynthesis protein TsaB
MPYGDGADSPTRGAERAEAARPKEIELIIQQGLMPIFLHIDTSTPICSVAVSRDGLVLSAVELDDQQHAAQLTNAIISALQEAGLSLSNIDALSLAKGPGSYTGLRIGVSTAKSICFALQKPLISFDSLLPTAWALRQNYADIARVSDCFFLPMIDARRMDAYCAIYDRDLQLVEQIDCRSPSEDWLAPYIGKPIIWGGNAVQKYRQEPWAVHLSATKPLENSARHLAALTNKAYLAQKFENLYSFEPFYLKPPAFTQAKNVLGSSPIF